MEHLKRLRIQRGLKQKDIAEHLGIDRTTYVKYEKGQSNPSFATILKLAEYFGVTTDYLLERTDCPTTQPIPFSELLDCLPSSWNAVLIGRGSGAELRYLELNEEQMRYLESIFPPFKTTTRSQNEANDEPKI